MQDLREIEMRDRGLGILRPPDALYRSGIELGLIREQTGGRLRILVKVIDDFDGRSLPAVAGLRRLSR